MTLIDKSARGQSEELEFELELRHLPEKVWRALTDPSLLAEWLLPAFGLELLPGASFRFEAPPQPGWDGKVYCRFEEIEPERKLSYRWDAGDIATVVTFTLTPTEAGTRLSLVQSGFRDDQKLNYGGARYGWRLMGGKLIDLLERTP